MTKRIEPDIIHLKAANKAISKTTPRMRAASLKFLWDKWIANPRPEAKP